MNPEIRGKEPGRLLFLGVADSDRIFGIVASGLSPAAAQIRAEYVNDDGALLVPFLHGVTKPRREGRELLLSEFSRIHSLGWLKSSQLQNDGTLFPCVGNRCGGHTLEAQLGITANGRAEPDFEGWEVKQYGVPEWHRSPNKPVTLFTPEPDRGVYAERGTSWFVHKYGRQTQTNRFDFTGRHFAGREPHPTTGLRLVIDGYDPDIVAVKDRVTVDGAITLVDENDVVAAGWSFAKLLEHWKRKHAQAAYLPSQRRRDDAEGDQFRYGPSVHLGTGTSFLKFLEAMADGHIAYDPACKTVLHQDGQWRAKPRNQIRIGHRYLPSIYDEYERIALIS